jgi:protein-glutamine gamma-glutamyltransferase
MFDAFVRLLVMLVLLRLVTARRTRDLRDAGMLAFFMPVAATAVDMSFGLVFVLVGWVLAAVTMLVIAHDLGEAERAGATPPALAGLRTGRGVVMIGLAGSAVTFGVTLALFFVIPRVGEVTLALRGGARKVLIGFTDTVQLGAIGQLEKDTTVVMRVQLPDGPLPPGVLSHLRWRGVSLERFDGQAWSSDRQRKLAIRRFPDGPIDVQPPRGGGVYLRQAVFLEPIGTDVVFAAPHALRLWARSGAALVDAGGAISVPEPAARLQYSVDSAVGGPPWGGRLEPEDAGRYLQLSRASSPPARARRPRRRRRSPSSCRATTSTRWSSSGGPRWIPWRSSSSSGATATASTSPRRSRSCSARWTSPRAW